VAGIILSGNMKDRTRRMIAIKRCGGAAIVQDRPQRHSPACWGAPFLRWMPICACRFSRWHATLSNWLRTASTPAQLQF